MVYIWYIYGNTYILPFSYLISDRRHSEKNYQCFLAVKMVIFEDI